MYVLSLCEKWRQQLQSKYVYTLVYLLSYLSYCNWLQVVYSVLLINNNSFSILVMGMTRLRKRAILFRVSYHHPLLSNACIRRWALFVTNVSLEDHCLTTFRIG